LWTLTTLCTRSGWSLAKVNCSGLSDPARALSIGEEAGQSVTTFAPGVSG
jgi:hypothetical protein